MSGYDEQPEAQAGDQQRRGQLPRAHAVGRVVRGEPQRGGSGRHQQGAEGQDAATEPAGPGPRTWAP